MGAWFRERRPNSGVDGGADCGPAMIIPVPGGNLVQLEYGAGLTVEADHNLIQVREVDSDGFPRKPSDFGVVHHGYFYRGSRGSGIDIGAWESFPGGGTSHTRYFYIYGAANPIILQVRAKDRHGTQAHIQVAALNPRVVHLAIRQVKAKDKDGNLSYHSKHAFDPEAWVKHMNEIWTPQANVVFQLVSTQDAVITDQDESKIAKLLDLKDADKAPLPEIVSSDKLAPLFHDLEKQVKGQQVDFTMFMVKNALDKTLGVNGVTDPENGFALIADSQFPDTMAHEAGHFLGYNPKSKVRYGHYDFDFWLMAPGAGVAKRGQKIPFDHVIKYFNPPEQLTSQQPRKR